MGHFISGKRIYFDTETTGLEIWKTDKPFAFSFCNQALETAYFEFDVDPRTREPIIGRRERSILSRIGALLEDPKIEKVGHNVKFDRTVMKNAYGIEMRGRVEDTMHKYHLCNSLELNYGLKQLCVKLGIMGKDDQDLLHKATVRARRKAARLGWNISFKMMPQPLGPPKKKAQVPADYWLPRALWRYDPGLVQEGDELLCRDYAIKDVVRCAYLDVFTDEMMEELDTREIYEELELPLSRVIYRMERRGPAVNPQVISKQKELARQKIAKMKPELEKLAWKGFNPDSPHQVRKWVLDKLDMDVDKFTEKGNPSIGREWMQDNLEHPAIYALAKYRTGVKAFGSFFARYESYMTPDELNPGGFAIHANFNQLGPATGRLSCRDPNLQNVMDPTVSFSIDPMHVRNVFIPRPGYWWLCVDYSNMEVRVFAALSEEPGMLESIRKGNDIHSDVANRIWGGEGNPLGIRQAIRALQLDGTGTGTSEQVTKLWKEWGIKDPLKLSHKDRDKIAYEWLKRFNFEIVPAQDSVGRRYARNIGKMVTFLKIYGGGMRGARKLLKLPDEEIVIILREYDARHPRIVEYSRELIGKAEEDESIRTLWNRRLTIDPNFEYRAVNYMVQGSSADLMKWSIVTCDKKIRGMDVDAHVLLTVHDELIFEVRQEDMTTSFVREMCGIMESADGRLPITMPVEPKIAKEDWSKKLKIKNLQARIAFRERMMKGAA